jgi:hypothetical protein
MRVWLISFLLLFGAAEVFQWLRQMSLPMPIFILGGAFLAIASNYDKLSNLPFHLDYQEPHSPDKTMPGDASNKAMTGAQGTGGPVKSGEGRSISFEIRKPFQPRD